MRSPSHLVVVTVTLFCACGDNHHEVVGDDARSGSRLRLISYDVDGVHAWDLTEPRYFEEPTYFDALRAEPCTPPPWVDGTLRCTPDGVDFAFGDAACTQPFARSAGLYAGVIETRCDVRRHRSLFRVGREVPGPVFVRAPGGSCSASDGPRFELLDEVRAEELAEISTALARSDDPLFSLRYHASADGLLAPIRIHAHEFASDCELIATFNVDPTIPCYLRDTVYIDPSKLHFANADCTGVPELARERGCPVPRFATDSDGLRSIGEASSASRHFQNVGGVCTETRNSNATYHPLGDPVDRPTLSRTHRPSAERISVIYVGSPTVRYRNGLFDSAHQSECEPLVMGDGTLRCLPTTYSSVQNLFEDESCTQPIQLALHLSDGGDYAWSRFAKLTPPGQDPTVVTVGAPYTGPAFERSEDGAFCTSYSLATYLYTITETIPLTEFVPATPIE